MGSGHLFGEPDRVRSQQPKDLQQTITCYCELYQARVGEAPVLLAADLKLLKSLLARYGREKVVRRLTVFVERADAYVIDQGYSLALFYRSWNKLAAAEAAPAEQGPVPDAQRTDAYLRRLYRTGRRR